MSVLIHSLPKGFRRKALEKTIEKVLEREKRKEARLALLFLSSVKMTELNSKYRKIEGPTDVLSFSSEEEKYLGEIVICLSEIKKNAKRFGEPFKKELARVLIHGILHLLGYEHERGGQAASTMMKKQEYYLGLN